MLSSCFFRLGADLFNRRVLFFLSTLDEKKNPVKQHFSNYLTGRLLKQLIFRGRITAALCCRKVCVIKHRLQVKRSFDTGCWTNIEET